MNDWFLILSWGSPLGLAIFFVGIGLLIFLLAKADAARKDKEK
jgi:hypothetical protein